MSKRVLRFTVPVDDQWHRTLLPAVMMNDSIVHIAARREDAVDVWAIDLNRGDTRERFLRVFATGQEIPDQGDLINAYLGTAVTPSGALVWHLFEQVMR